MSATSRNRRLGLYLLLGMYFGIVMTKAEVISWYRIQEMFRFQAFHMYGIIGLAVVVGLISVQLIKGRNARDLDGNWAGGTIFGLGWALTGACPGPLFVLVGNGVYIMLVAFAAAVVGTWVYGALRPHLPH